jgi:signal transduction histidine kinase
MVGAKPVPVSAPSQSRNFRMNHEPGNSYMPGHRNAARRDGSKTPRPRRAKMARAEAERANRLRDEFLGNLSHELRTPLNSILLWAQTLQLRMEDRRELMQGLQAIERNTRVQTQLISDLLDLSRITSGKLHLDIQPTNPASVVRAALDVMSPAAAAKDMTVETESDQSAGLVSGESFPLATNRLEPGQQRDQVHPQRRAHRGQLQRVQSQVEINVTDNGRGVSPDLLPFLFERFRQLALRLLLGGIFAT